MYSENLKKDKPSAWGGIGQIPLSILPYFKKKTIVYKASIDLIRR